MRRGRIVRIVHVEPGWSSPEPPGPAEAETGVEPAADPARIPPVISWRGEVR